MKKYLTRSIVLSLCGITCLAAKVHAQDSILELEESLQFAEVEPVKSKPDGVPAILTSTSPAGSKAEMIRQRYPSGKTNVERWVVESAAGDFVNHGNYVEYSEAGAVVASGTYNMGVREGSWSKQLNGEAAKQLTKSQLIGFKPPFISKANFRDGQLHGDWTCSDAKGDLVFVWTFKEGVRDGITTFFNAKGEVIQSLTYEKNLAHGPAKISTSPDRPPEDVQFEQGRMQRTVDQYYPATGKKPRTLKSQDSYLAPTPYNIVANDWSANQVTFQSVSKDDLIRHGAVVTFFSNGQRESQGEYSMGKRVGTFAWWYPNGQQKAVGDYQNDQESGRWDWWHENGMRQVTGLYEEGQQVGVWSLWNATGKLVKRAEQNADSRTANRMENVAPLTLQ